MPHTLWDLNLQFDADSQMNIEYVDIYCYTDAKVSAYVSTYVSEYPYRNIS